MVGSDNDPLKELSDTQAKMQESAQSGQTSLSAVKTVVLISTPTNMQTFIHKIETKTEAICHSVVLDKVDLLQAMDFKSELIQLAKNLSSD